MNLSGRCIHHKMPDNTSDPRRGLGAGLVAVSFSSVGKQNALSDTPGVNPPTTRVYVYIQISKRLGAFT